MEFGEKLKQTREEKGMTQQALAQQLFVTRQAVSRWECGARYPDLITVRKLSQILDISLDELLSEEDHREIVKKTPVLESARDRGLQSAVYAMAAVPYLMRVITLLWDCGTGTGDRLPLGMTAVELLLSLCCLGAMAFGVYLSVTDKLNPKMICVMNGAYFLASFLPGIVKGVEGSAGQGPQTVPYLAANVIVPGLFCCLLIAAPCRYYLARKTGSPWLVYLCGGGLLLSSIVRFAGRLWIIFVLGSALIQKSFSEVLLQCFCDSGFAILMLLQSRVYHKKRKLAEEGKAKP